VSGGEESFWLGEGGELGITFISLVARGEVRCCARWSFDGVFGEPGREDIFFGGSGIGLLRWVDMVVALCEM
jgi:hypothetical protein